MELRPFEMTGTDTSPFGALLRRHRVSRGLSQERLAERAGLSVDAIGLLERGGRRRPRTATVMRLGRALGLPAEDQDELVASVRRPPHPTPAGSLPVPLTPLVGRDGELAEACAHLRAPDCRLVTLTGPPGVGKTRLGLSVARELAADFGGGAGLVDLGACPRGQDAVLRSIGRALGLAGDPALDAVLRRLGSRRRLLVLDGFEHLLPEAAGLTALLTGCPQLRVLVTSRATLRLGAERELRLAPLPVPDDGLAPPAIAQSPAVRLFSQRAQAVSPGFEITAANAGAVAAICRSLDGLPLAIELAARWIRLQTPQELLVRTDDPLSLLVSGPRDLPPRQQTLRATLQWSCDILDAAELALFRRLSVFEQPAELTEAFRICQAAGPLPDPFDKLAGLVEKSLVACERVAADTRVRMLRTIREYGRELLAASGEADVTRAALARTRMRMAV